MNLLIIVLEEKKKQENSYCIHFELNSKNQNSLNLEKKKNKFFNENF